MKLHLLLLVMCFVTTLKAQNLDSVMVKDDKVKEIYNAVEIEPEFPGGPQAFYAFLGMHLNYPAKAIKNKIGGKVFVAFVVEPDGSLSDIKITRSPSEDLSAETMRVFRSSPRWRPGIQNGKPVRVAFNIFVNFDLIKALDAANKGTTEIKDSTLIDKAPEFPGGADAMRKYLRNNIEYTKDINGYYIYGDVILTLYIEPDGSITDIKVINTSSEQLVTNAIKLVKKFPKWKPGLKDNKPVRVMCTLPVSFRVNAY